MVGVAVPEFGNGGPSPGSSAPGARKGDHWGGRSKIAQVPTVPGRLLAAQGEGGEKNAASKASAR